MASELLSSIVGGGGSFSPDFISGRLTVSSGSSGDILTIPSVSGKTITLTGLRTSSGTEAGITVKCGSRTIITSLTLTDLNAAEADGQFSVSSVAAAGSVKDYSGNITDITARPSESIVISKDTGSTAVNIRYSYAYG